MKNKSQFSAQDIHDLSYPDFVAFINQKNTPPGGELTTTLWTEKAGINKNSFILDLACTTGFSSRTISKITGCKGVGIDISEEAIKGAQKEAETNGLKDLIYKTADACDLPFDDQVFTHILGGCNFSFIRDREIALRECSRTLSEYGILCISSFYYSKEPPQQLLDDVNEAIGFKPDSEWTADFWDRLFSTQFSKEWEDHYDLPMYESEAVENLIKNQIYTKELREKINDDEILDACYERLLKIRLILNNHRNYQRFCIQTWRKK
jgi:ubiquinone/menaquinone biosynthesis C-methylase UbiE